MSRRRPAPDLEADAVRIIAAYCRLHGLTPAELRDHARLDLHPWRRQVMRLLRLDGLSYPGIGWMLDRDHSTVKHAIPDVPRGYLNSDRPADSPGPAPRTPVSVVTEIVVREVPMECNHPDMVRLPPRVREHLGRVARSMGRSPDWLAAQILARQLEPVVARLVDTPSGASGSAVRDVTSGHRTTSGGSHAA